MFPFTFLFNNQGEYMSEYAEYGNQSIIYDGFTSHNNYDEDKVYNIVSNILSLWMFILFAIFANNVIHYNEIEYLQERISNFMKITYDEQTYYDNNFSEICDRIEKTEQEIEYINHKLKKMKHKLNKITSGFQVCE